MKSARGLLLMLGLLSSTSAGADPGSELAASKLLDSMDMQSVLDTSINASLDGQLSSRPELAPYRDVIRAFLAKYMSYEALKPKLVAVYASEFSALELTEAAAFYETPTGQKFLAKLPILFNSGAEIGREAVTEHIPELEQAIQAESQRLQALQAADEAR